MKTLLKSALVLGALSFSTLAAAQITFYESEGFQGRAFTTQGQIDSFGSYGFNDRASSVVVERDTWEICEDARFGGRCAVLHPGRYPSLSSMGLGNRILSARNVNWSASGNAGHYAAAPDAYRDYQRRSSERLYEANVTSARAVLGAAEQRCWIEQQAVPQQQSGANVAGAISALIGGILGHGTGQDIATLGAAAASGFVGSNVGRGYSGQQMQNVQRCENASQAAPSYWEVTYNFRGLEHRVQMTSQPGPTVTVNEQGEPRS